MSILPEIRTVDGEECTTLIVGLCRDLRGAFGVPEIAEVLGLPVDTVERVLLALRAMDFAEEAVAYVRALRRDVGDAWVKPAKRVRGLIAALDAAYQAGDVAAVERILSDAVVR